MKKNQFIVLSSALVLLGSPLIMAEPSAEASVSFDTGESSEATPKDEETEFDLEKWEELDRNREDGRIISEQVVADAKLGQDDKATVIEGSGTSSAKVTHIKKGPVALVKQGRVFLR